MLTETLIEILKWQVAALPLAVLVGLTYAAFTTPLPDRGKRKT